MAAKKAPPKPSKTAKTTKRLTAQQRIAKAGGPTVHAQRRARIENRTESNMSPKQKDRADRFITEYLRDFNATRAFIRTLVSEGREAESISLNYAATKGCELLTWPYVAFKIQDYQEKKSEAVKEIITLDEIHYVYKREMHDPMNKGSTRVSAAQAAERSIYGEPDKNVNVNVRGGVMVLPPDLPLEEWERQTQTSQATLKEEVRK